MTLTSKADLNPISHVEPFDPIIATWPSGQIFSGMSVTLTSKEKLLVSLFHCFTDLNSIDGGYQIHFSLLAIWANTF